MPQSITKAMATSPLSQSPSASGHEPRVITAIGAGAVEWAESPAKLLHDRLVSTFVAPASEQPEETLSPRAKLAILVGLSASLWLAIGLAVAAVA